MKQTAKITIVALCVICAATLMSGCLEPECSDEREVYHVEVPYQSPVYKTVSHSEPIYEIVYHKDPIYDTRKHSDPIYETVDHSEPIYETLTSLELRDASALGDEVYRYNNVYDMDYWYSGRDTWGNAEYTFTVYYYDANWNNFYHTVYQIDEWSSSTYEVITGYNTWSEEVIVGYDEWNEEILVGYDEWSEEVVTGYNVWDEEMIDYYETLYRTEERYYE